MATVNLKIGSGIGFNIVGGNSSIIGNAPQMQTIRHLDGTTYTPNPKFTTFNGPLLSVDALTDFATVVDKTSDRQTVKMTNHGNELLTITDFKYSFSAQCGPRFLFSTDTTVINGQTIKIEPGNTANVDLVYIANTKGNYNNYFVIMSDSVSGPYRVNTHQTITTSTDLVLSPVEFNTTTTVKGKSETVTYKLTNFVNEVALKYNTPVAFTATLVTGSYGWAVEKVGGNYLTLKFNPWEVSNANGTYVSTLTVTSNGISRSVVSTATISLDTSHTKNYINWISPLSYYNSIIGISYDLVAGKRVLTLGVGVGGDGVPVAVDAYDSASIDYLGIGYGNVSAPYFKWAEVVKIELTGNEQTYYSGDYVVKTSPTLSYMKYFGKYNSQGSMFVVQDDGYGCLKIELNTLRELSGDTSTDVTLQNLTRAFHYYSSADAVGRPIYSQPDPDYTTSLDDYTTYLFTGFNLSRAGTAFITRSIVDLPT